MFLRHFPTTLMNFQKKIAILKAGIKVRVEKIRQKQHTGSNKILIIQLDPLGDTALLIAYLRSINFDAQRFDVCCLQSLAPMWKMYFPDLTVFTYPTRSWNKDSLQRVGQQLSMQNYAAVLLPCVSPPGAYLSSFCHTPLRAGIIEDGRYYSGSRLLLDRIWNAPADEHVVERFRHLFSLWNTAIANPQYPLRLPRKSEEREENLILIHPGGKWKPRRWMPERYQELVHSLVKQDYTAAIIIHEQERDLLDFFSRAKLPPSAKVVITRSIDDLLRVLSQAAYFIGNDSGPAHCAALMGIPTIVLWGPGNLHRIHPIGEKVHIILREIECRPCKQYIFPDRCERGTNDCLQRITVSEVLNAFQFLTNSKNA